MDVAGIDGLVHEHRRLCGTLSNLERGLYLLRPDNQYADNVKSIIGVRAGTAPDTGFCEMPNDIARACFEQQIEETKKAIADIEHRLSVVE